MVGQVESCKLLGPVSLLTQFFVGVVALGLLLLKREYQRPKRPWAVWKFDVAKQITGALGVHLFNVLTSVSDAPLPNSKMAFSREDDHGDKQCLWYFANLLMDTTVGVPIIWFWLKLIHYLLGFFNISNIESGNYYPEYEYSPGVDSEQNKTPSKPLYSAFFKQLLIFITGLSLTKLCTFIILYYFEGVAYWFSNLILGWSDPWPNFQIFIIMFIAPAVLNAFQWFFTDSIIMLSARRTSIQYEEVIELVPCTQESRTPRNSVDQKQSLTSKPFDSPGQLHVRAI
ncbi:HEL138Wp [Eremothecium sinecaudum]|uniref:HEL138Wp n=1 Tax=Eremothecium sinecaudum TaxID=45286 RepID=A0A0X8HTI8_9SACH|nr:HEL138Wp [Eremothecium sinecaudum]AMD21143.1 HEL138Wp [Eremothecium sinecaudum]